MGGGGVRTSPHFFQDQFCNSSTSDKEMLGEGVRSTDLKRAITIIYSCLCYFHIKIALARQRQQLFSLEPLNDVVDCDVITYRPPTSPGLVPPLNPYTPSLDRLTE